MHHDTRAPDMDEEGEFNTIDEPVMTTIVRLNHLFLSNTYPQMPIG